MVQSNGFLSHFRDADAPYFHWGLAIPLIGKSTIHRPCFRVFGIRLDLPDVGFLKGGIPKSPGWTSGFNSISGWWFGT